MYLSPCLAGCKDSPGYNNFTSCSCIGDSGSAIRQQCDNECGVFIPFVVVTFILIFLTFWVTMPSTMATLRCVREQERSLALGLQNIFIRLLGTIPGPVMFGYYIDNTCTLWNKSCDESGHGSCLLYENYDFSVFMCVACFVSKLISLIFFVASRFASQKSDIKDVGEEDTANNNLQVHVNNSFENDIDEDSPTRTRI